MSNRRRWRDIAGQRYGKLTVLAFSHSNKRNRAQWICKCDCGVVRAFDGANLRYGAIKSCGCLSRQKTVERLLTHGESASSEYQSWRAMMKRCYSVNDIHYHRYGGRGIQVCTRWFDVKNFLEDMGRRPAGLTLDRINNNGNYEPMNCRWATRQEQSRNTASNRLLAFRGQLKCLAEWAEITAIRQKLISNRLADGWTVEAALTTPVDFSKSHKLRLSTTT